MKYFIGCAVASLAMAVGGAQADLVNGDFNASQGGQGRQNAKSPQASQSMHRPQGG